MKPLDARSSAGLDRLATWNEVHCALSLSAQSALELVAGCAAPQEEDADSNRRSGYSQEDILAIVCAMLDSTIN
jgi:hypothetical protein